MIEAQNRNAIYTKMYDKLTALYDEAQAHYIFDRLKILLDPVHKMSIKSSLVLSECDVVLIAYGDHVQRTGEQPLSTLHSLLNQLALPINSVHILPFYPYTSDDGFSVIDYEQVDESLGDWEDVRRLGADYRLMFDAVFNHISRSSKWFQAFLRGEAPYTDYFITLPPDIDVSQVTRPRTHPLLTPFETAQGIRYVWTTFSDDQIDLNAANPDVLLELVKVLLFYIQQGAQFIRLDAIAFLWKQLGTTCIHLPETHTIIQLLRDVLDAAAPETILITETNVPHIENLSYFGDGTNEAQMVYQFALPPLILHTLATGNATQLTQWAETIERVGERTTFFNFTASHDGVGLRPVQGILSDADVEALVQRTLAHGGYVSYKSNSDGTQSPYELNITYFDAITAPQISAKQPQIAVSRFIVSQAMMLAVIGVPGIYFHSLFGSRNDHQGVVASTRFRSINREKLDADQLLSEVAETNTLRHRVFEGYKHLLQVRTSETAFHPMGSQKILSLHPSVFAVERISPDQTARIVTLHNVSHKPVEITPSLSGEWRNLFDQHVVDPMTTILLAPFQALWIKQI
jgi:glucosylglycerate phosphorylase